MLIAVLLAVMEQAVGQNLVILAIAFPTLVISAVFASCGSERVSDIAGRYDPLIYTYGIHAFATCFNRCYSSTWRCWMLTLRPDCRLAKSNLQSLRHGSHRRSSVGDEEFIIFKRNIH